MDYDEEIVAKIATQYLLLNSSLEKLREAGLEKGGVVLSYAIQHFNSAKDAVEFLRTLPSPIQKRLGMEELEEKVLKFGNTHIRL